MKRFNHKSFEYVFVDKITVSSLFVIGLLGRSIRRVLYFETISPLAKRLIGVLHHFGFFPYRMESIKYHIGQVRNTNGESQYIKINNDIRQICDSIKQDHFYASPLLKAMDSTWAAAKIVVYFDKIIERQIRFGCMQIRLSKWILQNQLDRSSEEGCLFIEKHKWFKYLKLYGEERNVSVIGYRVGLFHYVLRLLIGLLGIFRKVLQMLKIMTFRFGRRRIPVTGSAGSVKEGAGEKKPFSDFMIGICHASGKFTLNPNVRSELFWLNGVKTPLSEILIYNYVGNGCDDESLEELKNCQIRLFGKGPNIPAWNPTKGMYREFLNTLITLIFKSMNLMVHGRWIDLYQIIKLVQLAKEYAYWHDFYRENRVKVNVGNLNVNVAQNLALDSLEAVSIGYQYSVSNSFPTASLASGATLQFYFSSEYKRLLEEIEAPIDYFVKTGFIYDTAFAVVKKSPRIRHVRESLIRNGAEFVLCFFDETSIDKWFIPASKEDSAKDYKFLLKWLISDPKVGMIFKPKRALNLFNRISGVDDLIKAGSETGRCHFLLSDTIVGGIYPAEAALMADLCIGKLIGITAALEARLIGVPSILVDMEGFKSHSFYEWGRDKVVFDNWESLREAVESYRFQPALFSELGDWSPVLTEYDAFQDGQAGLRLGYFIRWVYESLKQGKSKEEAIKSATDHFARKWDVDHIAYE